jgi:hypothetical protein
MQLPGTKFVILKTTLLKNYTKVYSFEGDKKHLVIEEAVMHLKTHS